MSRVKLIHFNTVDAADGAKRLRGAGHRVECPAVETAAELRALLPDAVYTEWSRIRSGLKRAIAQPPARPLAPGPMAGYSGAPLAKKLGIRAGSVVALLGAPADFDLGALPDGVAVRRRAGAADVVILFAGSRADLGRRLPAAERAVVEAGRLWIAWRKRASGSATDLTQPIVRAVGLDAGWVDYKIASLDPTWSALCFARR